MAFILSNSDAIKFIKIMAEVKPDQKIKQQANRGRILLAAIKQSK